MIKRKKITQQSQQGRWAVQVGRIQRASLQSSQSGFTIIESLMAIVVVTILMTAIAPVIVLSVGTRVQARRVELATQAARTYINAVRFEAIAAPMHTISLNEFDSTTRQFTSQRDTFADAGVPATGSLSCPTTTVGYPYCQNTSTSSLYCIDLDTPPNGCSSDSPKDFVVQAFRSVTSTPTDANQGYLVGIRVYRADAFNGSAPLKKTKQPTGPSLARQATFTQGLGDRKASLMEMTTEIFVTNRTTYQNYCDRVGGCN